MKTERNINFRKGNGLKDLIVNRKIKNLVDYMVGVEAGLDSMPEKKWRARDGEHC